MYIRVTLCNGIECNFDNFDVSNLETPLEIITIFKK